MPNMKALHGRFAELNRQANAMIADKGDSVWTAEEQAQFDNWTEEMQRIKDQINSIERMRDLDADKHFDNIINARGNKGDVSVMDAFDALMRRGFDNISDEAKAILRPMNAMAKGTAADGGYTVPEELATYVIDKMKAFGGMRMAANVISTDTGVKMKWPTSDGTAEVGEIVDENAKTNSANPTFGIASLEVFKYSSKSIAISWELLQDSGVDIIKFLTDRLATTLARIQIPQFTVGTGTSQPKGIVTAAAANTANVVTSAAKDKVSYEDLVNIQHAIDPAYRNNVAFMMSDATLAKIRLLKDNSGRPIWGIDNMTSGAPVSLLGCRVIINQDMPAANPIIFGDLSSYMIRDVRSSVEMRRFDDSKYAEYGQAGFCQWMRSGGDLLIPSGVALLKNATA